MRGKGRLGLKVVVAAVTRPLSSARIGEAPVDQSFIFLRGFSLQELLLPLIVPTSQGDSTERLD